LQEDIAAITKELQSVFKTGAAFSSARVQYAVANMRLSGNKYLLSNDQEAYSKANEYVDLAQSELVKVIGEADYPPLAEAFEKAGADIATYAAAISEVHEIISQRNDIITGTLDVVGPALSDSVEELKLSLKERQDTLGPSIQSTMANGVVIASVLAGGGALLSLAFAILIATGITRPVQAITRAMSALADNKLETEIPGLDHKSEIGEMAKAVDVFKQNAIRVRDLTAQEAALQAKNTDLQSNISTVVAAAVAGDFSKRITARYDNPDLDAFASNVNTLVESVDTGIAETQRVIGALAEGDLTEEMTGSYQGVFAELQSNVNGTMDSLRKLMEEVRSSTDVINGGADQIRNASNDLSRRTETQAASLEETSSALEEITVAVHNSTERAQDSSRMVTEARKFAEQSAVVVQDANAAMSRIEEASGKIDQDHRRDRRDRLPDQPSGAQCRCRGCACGRSWQGLCRRRPGSPRTGAPLGQRRQGDQGTDRSVRRGSPFRGVELVGETGEAITRIISRIEEISEHVGAMATASREQATGLAEVNTAVNQMDQMTQQNAAMVEDSINSRLQFIQQISDGSLCRPE
jgi:methyl-accepting chemotaxis protein